MMEANRWWRETRWRPNVSLSILVVGGVGIGMVYAGHYANLDAILVALVTLAIRIVEKD